MQFKKNIPNFITCLNLLCGCIAVVCVFENKLVWSAYLVGIAAVLDFLDGFAARLLKIHSEIGKQLDSLADMVTFGLVPGVVLFKLIETTGKHSFVMSYDDALKGFACHAIEDFNAISYIGFVVTIFSAIRLAKFNIDTRQTDSFIGLPTPANSILIVSLPLILQFNSSENSVIRDLISSQVFLVGLSIVLSYLLVAELPLFALKFKTFNWADNKIRYLFLIISGIMLVLFQFIAIPFIIFLYIVLSVINNTLKTNPQ